MQINKIVKDALFKYQQQDYKRGGVSIAPEMYEAIANEIEVKVKNLAQPDVSGQLQAAFNDLMSRIKLQMMYPDIFEKSIREKYKL